MEDYRNKNFVTITGFIDKMKNKINPGLLLLFVAIVTMFIANWDVTKAWYGSLWDLQFILQVGDFNFFSIGGKPLSSLEFINDGLMTIFFFYVGLEIKREVLVGELSSFRQAILPIIAAAGGMLIPMLFFFLVGNHYGFDATEFKGVAIPMATDIAFSLGVLTLLGKRVPMSLKIFLLTLAITDDIGGILIIAMAYSHIGKASLIYLLVSLGLFILLLIGNRLRINNKVFYYSIGIIVWYLFLQAGIHPTIAGVIVAFTVPARPYINLKKYTDGLQRDINVINSTIRDLSEQSIILSNIQVRYLARIEAASDRVISPLQDLEDSLGDFVNYIIMPLFAFANAGVVFDISTFSPFTGVSLAVMVGLILGKLVGIFSFTFLAIKLKISKMPNGMDWANLAGLSMLGGIGFTVSLFLAGLSYTGYPALLNDAKTGIIFGSLIAGFLGFIILNFVLKKDKSPKTPESI